MFISRAKTFTILLRKELSGFQLRWKTQLSPVQPYYGLFKEEMDTEEIFKLFTAKIRPPSPCNIKPKKSRAPGDLFKWQSPSHAAPKANT